MSRPASVLRSGCTARLSALRNRQKAQFLCDTCTDVCQEIIHMPGGEFVLPINSCTPEQRTLHLRTLLQSGMIEERTKTTCRKHILQFLFLLIMLRKMWQLTVSLLIYIFAFSLPSFSPTISVLSWYRHFFFEKRMRRGKKIEKPMPVALHHFF